MSGTGPVSTGHIPDIKYRCPEYGQLFLAIFRTSSCDVRNVTRILDHNPDITGPIPDITGHIPDITGHVPDFTGLIPDINFVTKSMSGTRPVETGHIPDIKGRCPVHGQEKLALFRTSKIDVRDMASFNWPCSGHQPGHVPDNKKGRLGYLIQKMYTPYSLW